MQTRSSSRLFSNPSSKPTPSTNLNPKGRNRRRSKQRIEEFNLDEISPPIVTMADQCTMAQLLQAPTEGYEDAIVVPAITADNFELKHGLLTLVQNNQFFGHDKEDSHAHVRYFNKITSTLKFLNVLNTSIKLMLFPFSLEGAAQIWLEKEPLDRFSLGMILFQNSSTNSLILLKQPIFVMKSLIFNNVLMNLLVKHRIDSKILFEPVLIMSKSKVRYSRNKPVVAKVSTNTSTSGISPNVAELKDVVKALLLDKKNQNQSPATVKAVEESSYQALAYQAPDPQTQSVSNEDFSAYVKANDAVIRNMQTLGQNMQNQLTNLTELITKFVNSNSASTSSSGTLPSNTIANPRSDLKAITTRSGVSYNGPQIPPLTSFLPKSKSPTLTPEPATSLISEPVIALHQSNAIFCVKKLSLPDLTPTCMTLELANCSISHPVRVAEDVYVKVGSFHFSADFVVVDFDADPRVPLILERSFLKTGRALIDVFEGELTLRVGKEAITFNLDQTSRCSANYNDMTAKRIDIIDMTCKEYS
nr:reverse transcriptase domain-containing protein [Tanacetum cinerariifolium]